MASSPQDALDDWGDDFVSEDEIKFDETKAVVAARQEDPVVVQEAFQLMLEEDKRTKEQIAADEKLALNMIVDEHEVRPKRTYASVLRPPAAAPVAKVAIDLREERELRDKATAALKSRTLAVALVAPQVPRSTRASRRKERKQAALIHAALAPISLEGIQKKLLTARSIIEQALHELSVVQVDTTRR